jgi:hypothetical protein
MRKELFFARHGKPEIICRRQSVFPSFRICTVNEIVSEKGLAAGELPDAAADDLKNAPELSEQSYKKTERRPTVSTALSALLAAWIILLLPADSAYLAKNILLSVLVAALALNKERSGGYR